MFVIDSSGRPPGSRLKELWGYRELILFLTWREVMIRHKQTFVGIAWVVLQPLLAMLVLALVLSKLFRVGDTGAPYPLFCLAGLVPWNFFAAGLSQASNSLVMNPDLITKIYFPRVAMPLSVLLAGMVDFAINLAFLALALIWYRVMPTVHILWIPLFILLTFTAVLGVSLWLAALNVEYRDVRYVIPFMTQLWMFATPVFYPASLIRGPYQLLYALNPMDGAVEGFRWALWGGTAFPSGIVAVSCLSAFVLLTTGLLHFGRAEVTFADIV